MIDRASVWRQVTGGGRVVDFLRWLAAQWELYVEDQDQQEARPFDEWLVARYSGGSP